MPNITTEAMLHMMGAITILIIAVQLKYPLDTKEHVRKKIQIYVTIAIAGAILLWSN